MVTFHALRHTHASVLIKCGVDILTVAKRLGHAEPSMTLNTYAHLIEGADEAAAKAIEGMLKGRGELFEPRLSTRLAIQ